MRMTSLLVTLALVAAVPLAAQRPAARDSMRHGMMGQGMMQGGMMQGMGMDSMMAPMMRSMAFAPEHLLGQKQALHLTSDQETRLTALRDGAKSAHDAAAHQAQMHMGEMEQVMHAAAPDTAAVKHHFDAAHRLMGDAHWAMLSSAAMARAVLTDAQRKQVDDMAARPMSRGGMMRH